MAIRNSSVFQLTADSELPSNQITTELNSLRSIVTKKFYTDLSSDNQEVFQSFLWSTLQKFTLNTNPAVRLAASSVMGNILLRLSPFFSTELMNYLLDSIKLSTDKDNFYVFLTSFVFLSKYVSASTLNKVLSSYPILNLFNISSSEHLPNLVSQMDNFPTDFLVLITDSFIQIAIQNPTNRHFPKAAAVLISKSIDDFDSILAKPNLTLPLISSLFPDRLPKTLNDKISKTLAQRCVLTLQNESSLPVDYEAACRVLTEIVTGDLIDKEMITNEITIEIVSKSPNLAALLALPIKEEIINELFLNYSSEMSFSEVEFDKTKINPLLTYFSHNSQFADKLIILLTKHLTPQSDSYSYALKILGNTAHSLPIESLNNLLDQALSIDTPNWIHKLWTLELIVKLPFKSLSRKVSDLAFHVIEACSISKTDKLNEVAKEVTVKIFESTSIDIFKLFVDEYCRKIDVFDKTNFELRISFITYIFKKTDNNWTIGFAHLASMITEAITLFDFSSKIMMDIFYIIGILANNLKEDFSILLLFAKKALDIIEPSYHEFCGEELNIKRSSLFISNSSTTNLTQTARPDTDLTSNPSCKHTDLIKSADAAFSMIVMVPWSQLEMQYDDVHYLYLCAMKLLPLFPHSSNLLIAALMDHSILLNKEIIDFINESLIYSQYGDGLFSLARIIAICIDRFPNFTLSNFEMFPDYIHTLKAILKLSHDLDYLQVISAIAVLNYDNHHLSNDFIKSITKKAHHYLLPGYAKKESENENPSLHSSSSSLLKVNTGEQQQKKLTQFLVFCQTISPFLYKKLEVPIELLCPPLLNSFFNNSTVKIDESQAESLLVYIIENTNKECLKSFLNYLLKNKIRIKMRQYLKHPFFQKKSVMQLVAVYMNIKKLPNIYITTVMKTENLTEFVLNASTASERKLSINLIKLDPEYFVKQFISVEKYKYKQIENLCLYAQANIEFPPEDFYNFAVILISKNIESRKKKNIVRRLLTLVVYFNLKNLEIVRNAHALLSCDVVPKSNITILQKQDPAQIMEFYYESLVIKNSFDCTKLIETLILTLTKSTSFGLTLDLITSPPSVESISSIVSALYPVFPLPSMQNVFFHYYIENLNKSNPIQVPQPPILKLLLSIQNDLNKSNPILNFSENHCFNFCLFGFVNTILSCLSNKSIQVPPNVVNKIAKDSFSFISTKFQFKLNKCIISQFMSMYSLFLSVINENDQNEIEIIKKNLSHLFETTIIPKSACDLVIKVSNISNDIHFAHSTFTNYLRTKDSYNSYLIAESASVYRQQTKSSFITISSSIDSNLSLQTKKKKTIPCQNLGSTDKLACTKLINPLSVLVPGKSFFAMFCALSLIKNRSKYGIQYKSFQGKLTMKQEKAIQVYADPILRPFSIIFALLPTDQSPIPKLLLSFISNQTKPVNDSK